MRIRRKPWARPELAACPFCIDEPQTMRGRWQEAYPQTQPLRLELGCGKGGFLAQRSVTDPAHNYLAVDIKSDILGLTKRNVEAAFAAEDRPADNVRIMAYNIEQITQVLSPEDRVERIYINFCNPWNKKLAHKKHRLTHTRQLALYRTILAENGEIYFKTDDDDLFRDSLAYFPEAGYEIVWKTFDLHADEPDWNIRTEHEAMFTEQGIPTKALIAVKKPMTADELAAAVAARNQRDKEESAAIRAAQGIQ